MENLLTLRQVSEILNVKESTLRSWVFQRRIPCVRIGRLVRFRVSDIDLWVKRGGNPKNNNSHKEIQF